jgi:hypothetical protein
MTDNYLKVRRGRGAVEFFFDSRHRVSAWNAWRAAHAYAEALRERADQELAQYSPDRLHVLARARSWSEAEIAAYTPEGLRAALAAFDVAVWQHGMPGFGDLKCVGGCEHCSPRPDTTPVEDET